MKLNVEMFGCQQGCFFCGRLAPQRAIAAVMEANKDLSWVPLNRAVRQFLLLQIVCNVGDKQLITIIRRF
jgi:hypothetical protein